MDSEKSLVLIPAFQEAKFIGRVLEMLKPLDSRPEYSLLVVDDGSTDGTGDIVREHGIRVLTHKTNTGKTSALKDGFKVAEGEGFTFLV